MGFRINTNIGALNAHANSVVNANELDKSLSRLSSGLRINSAADDASGMAIADSLRSQAATLGQAINNGNDAIGILQTADKAMDEQLKILDTIKTKATQAAQDGQSLKTRTMLQADINRLMEELDNIANTTAFNGKQLLSGNFTNQEFQIGSSSNQTIKASIGPTQSSKIGVTRFETGSQSFTSGVVGLTIKNYNGLEDFKFDNVVISTSVGTGLGALAEEINKSSDKTGVRATYDVRTTGVYAIKEGSTSQDFAINGVVIGQINYKDGDNNGQLISAINSVKDTTGVQASKDENGKLVLTSADGRGIKITGDIGVGSGILSNLTEGIKIVSSAASMSNTYVVSSGSGFSSGSGNSQFAALKATAANTTDETAGVTTLKGAMAVMDIAETAITNLDQIRADIGSVQNQLQVTINNITVTQVNVKAAESTIRDVDFASESANFSKYNILAQSGSYAMSQANAVQQNVLKLLQ
ncbi:flagellin [Campylobacter jejuni]|uniref:flagellin N-terminal helical domain-containing protein n=1 Tax=Campylobacter jejuni TaxID=197 RepID=UPI00073DC1DF|nr:flagellin [Campylobacter jejuni]ALW65641.1 flagellin [Campylobacter jejuni]